MSAQLDDQHAAVAQALYGKANIKKLAKQWGVPERVAAIVLGRKMLRS